MKTAKTHNIFIHKEYPDFKIDEVEILKNTKKMFSCALKLENIEQNSCIAGYEYEILTFDILFCDNKKIHQINLEYRQKDCPTDVISFAIFADSPKNERFIFDNEINLGEIIISLDKTKLQAEENSHTFEKELYFLIAHGILHILGFDHQDEKSLEYMWHTQEKMIEVINV